MCSYKDGHLYGILGRSNAKFVFLLFKLDSENIFIYFFKVWIFALIAIKILNNVRNNE
jgi:hypothetical protein